MADVYEQNLPQKTNLTTNDYVRVVGSDDVSYKQPLSDVAQKTIENYAGSTLAGSTQSVKGAIDGLKSSAIADKAELNASINEVASDLASESSTRASQDTNLQAQINQLVAPTGTAPNPAEIENARIGADNVTYTTLGDAIRTQVTDLKSALTDETNARILLAGRMTTAEGDIDTLETHKVAQPLDEYNQPTDGTDGQSLRTKGDGTTEWADVGLPTDAQTAQAVSDWLDDHPEATTTVLDGSLTYKKLVNGTLGFVTPQMFGAKGDGVTDDTATFSDCFASGHKRILIPKGTYILSDTITVPDGITVACEGVINKSGTFNHLFEIGSDCDIQLNIDIDKASATDFMSQTSADIYISGKTNTRIHDTNIINTDSRYAIWVDKSSHIIIENCYIDTYVYTAIGLRDGNADVKILSNTVLNGHGVQTNRYPICLNSSEGGLNVSKNIICDGNYIEDDTPRWEAIDAHDLLDSVISNNTMVNTLTGIAIVAREKASNNIVVNGNIYKNSKSVSLVASTFGITCAVYNGSSNIVISNNALYGCGNNIGTTDKGGIKVYGIENLSLTDNVINCSDGFGIAVYSESAHPMTDFLIDNNIIDGANIGIKITNSNGVTVTGEIKENTIKNCSVGISGMENNGVGYLNCVYAKDNIFKGCTTDFNNIVKGLLVSPSGTTSSGYGRKGMSIDFLAPQDGIVKAVCKTSGDDSNPATWETIHRFFPICGEYELDNGYANVWDDRITTNSFAVVTNHYKTENSPEQFISAVLPVAGRFVVYVRNKDGTNATGTVKLALLVIQAH